MAARVAPLLDESSDVRFSEPNRWGSGELEETAVRPGLVVEVRYDKVQGNRFRHGTKFVRWRDDKDPADCTWRELRAPRDPNAPGIEELLQLTVRIALYARSAGDQIRSRAPVDARTVREKKPRAVVRAVAPTEYQRPPRNCCSR